MNELFDIVASICIIVGAIFVLLGAVGVFRLKDFYSRLHAPTLITTLGLGLIALGSACALANLLSSLLLNLAGVLALLFCINLTTPITTHWLVRAQKAQEKENNTPE